MTRGIRKTSDGTWIAALDDGRELAFAEYGALAGRPVFYFHGTPSSRLEGAWLAEAAARRGFRVIAVDRPGLGRSSFQVGRRMLDWPDDVAELADLLGIERFGVAGHSGGGAFVFAAAYGLARRIEFAIAFCPWGPVTRASAAALHRLDRLYYRVAGRSPGLMRAAFAPVGWLVRGAPRLFFAQMRRSVSPPDREVLARPGFAEQFTRTLQEAFRAGGRGPAWDATICYRPWGFELADIPGPVHVWAGDQDIFVPNAMTEAVVRGLRQAVVHRLPGSGHLCVERWDAALAAVAG